MITLEHQILKNINMTADEFDKHSLKEILIAKCPLEQIWTKDEEGEEDLWIMRSKFLSDGNRHRHGGWVYPTLVSKDLS